MAFFTNLMSLKLSILWTNLLGVCSMPIPPFKGFLLSFKHIVVAKSNITCTKVLRNTLNINIKVKKNLRSQGWPFVWGFIVFFLLRGREGTALASKATCAGKDEWYDGDAAPKEWWTQKIPTDAASKVWTFRIWSSHNGLDRSMGVLVMFDAQSSTNWSGDSIFGVKSGTMTWSSISTIVRTHLTGAATSPLSKTLPKNIQSVS